MSHVLVGYELAPSISKLPRELLLLIFSFLSQRVLSRMPLVCRRFCEVSKADVLWGKVYEDFMYRYVPY